MNIKAIRKEIKTKNSYLCVGLDTDINRLPEGFTKDYRGVIAFNKEIINATHDYAISYKVNTAFYEQLGSNGWKALEKTREMLPDNVLSIADAKRGDIGNTSKMYAKAFFEELNFDSVTVAPYMGIDSVQPFLEFDNKWVILLALTSNKGSDDFQFASQDGDMPLYEKVMRKAQTWGSPEQLMFVVGATHPEKFNEIREIAPDHFLLVPGVGAQGGDLQEISDYGLNDVCGLLVNSSRGIIFASEGEDFAEKARASALKLQLGMEGILDAVLD